MCTNFSLPRILLLVWFCLLFTILQQVSDLVTSTGFQFIIEQQFKIATLTHKILATRQPPFLHNLIQVHQPSRVLQPSNFSKYHTCLLILDDVPLVTALLQHGIPFLPPLKLFIPIQPPEISRNDPAN